ncbi:MAG: alpha/beta fold hydrolase, partial [Eubacteriales bacterium]
MNDRDFRSIPHNPGLDGLAALSPDIVYSNIGGKPLTMRVLSPWNHERRYPLILLFIQGSGWTFPDINYELPQLAGYARHGYVVATVTHRSCRDGFPFPAFLQDVKCALRFLRAHSDEFAIDPDRVTAYGTSSGGNTALLLGMTGDDPRYKTDEYAGFSDAVSAVVECFGPTDLFDMYEFFRAQGGDLSLIEHLLGGNADSEPARKRAYDMSPLRIAKDGVLYPPTLILHGDCDHVVPYESQGLRMFERLKELDCDVSMIRVEGADHE